MRKIGLLKLRSVLTGQDSSLLNDEAAFLSSIDPGSEFLFTKPAKNQLNLFFIETGGAETYFRDVYEHFQAPYYLLVHGERNSLAAALEIASFLRQQNLEVHLIAGNALEIHHALDILSRAYEAKAELKGKRLGVIGKPSDWLIASGVDYKAVKKRFGIELVDISLKEFYAAVASHPIADEKNLAKMMKKTRRTEDLRFSFYIHGALKALAAKYRLAGLTLRCFDLVRKYQETACLAFGLLNQEGLVAACEGDIPSLLTMFIVRTLTDQPCFMANPARINPTTRQAVYAHCTCPFDMLSNFALTTHFESGLGFGIRGIFKKNEVTACKLSSDLRRLRLLGGRITDNLMEPRLCRSQIAITFSDDVAPLIDDPYGNHLLFTYGNYRELLDSFAALTLK